MFAAPQFSSSPFSFFILLPLLCNFHVRTSFFFLGHSISHSSFPHASHIVYSHFSFLVCRRFFCFRFFLRPFLLLFSKVTRCSRTSDRCSHHATPHASTPSCPAFPPFYKLYSTVPPPAFPPHVALRSTPSPISPDRLHPPQLTTPGGLTTKNIHPSAVLALLKFNETFSWSARRPRKRL